MTNANSDHGSGSHGRDSRIQPGAETSLATRPAEGEGDRDSASSFAAASFRREKMAQRESGHGSAIASLAALAGGIVGGTLIPLFYLQVYLSLPGGVFFVGPVVGIVFGFVFGIVAGLAGRVLDTNLN